jgi:hypothetical protein
MKKTGFVNPSQGRVYRGDLKIKIKQLTKGVDFDINLF